MEEYIHLMRDLNITDREIRVYLALIKLKESQTGSISKEANVERSHIYQILEKLMKKGLVSYKLINNIKVFMPAEPKALEELYKKKKQEIDNKQQEVLKLIENLQKLKEEKSLNSNYKYFENISGVKSMLYEMMEYFEEGLIAKTFTTQMVGFERLLGVYNEYHRKRIEKGVKSRLIFSDKDILYGKKREKKIKNLEIRFVKSENIAEWGVLGGKYLFILYSLEKKPIGFLIKDPIIAHAFETTFDLVWENAKK